MKKGGDAITMKDINDGKFCGACRRHQGFQRQGRSQLRQVPQKVMSLSSSFQQQNPHGIREVLLCN
jgi:hypothetical protein